MRKEQALAEGDRGEQLEEPVVCREGRRREEDLQRRGHGEADAQARNELLRRPVLFM